MAQLGGALRINFASVRIEDPGGLFRWPGKTRDRNVVLEWRAETPASGAVAEGSVTMDEVTWWQEWFAGIEEMLNARPRKDAPSHDPVARLWTPLAGQTVEFFVWRQPDKNLAVLALFTPDEAKPECRIAVETSTSYSQLAEFANALLREARALSKTG